MPQLHCYVPDAVAEQLQRHAAQLGQSMSGYLAELVKRDVNAGWPEGFEAALFGPQVDRSPLSVESAGLAQERIALQ
ncbi:MAG: hypothetical protein CVU24_02350 [Betaproteobacteria bacterium HGW-Betaproteobacteria-18]|nr:MAG: hypothetical protein CVU24_02350 [Betaproteobacteria bacterium HGW-Betaproteobacteria-18]